MIYCPACHSVLQVAGIQNCPKCQCQSYACQIINIFSMTGEEKDKLRKVIFQIDRVLYKDNKGLAQEFQKILGEQTLNILGLTLSESRQETIIVDTKKLAKLNQTSLDLQNALGQKQEIVSVLYEIAKQAGRDMMADRLE